MLKEKNKRQVEEEVFPGIWVGEIDNPPGKFTLP